MLEICGRSLFFWSILSLSNFSPEAEYIFVAQESAHAADFISKECRKLGIRSFNVIELETPTQGQAFTADIAAVEANPNNPFIIYNIDTFVRPAFLTPDLPKGDGWIPCFQASGDHWSFVQMDSEGRVKEVAEKVRISKYATVGLYWFKSADLYRKLVAEYYQNDRRYVNNEAYVCPLYNAVIANGGVVTASRIPVHGVIGMGTPTEFSDAARLLPVMSPLHDSQ